MTVSEYKTKFRSAMNPRIAGELKKYRKDRRLAESMHHPLYWEGWGLPDECDVNSDEENDEMVAKEPAQDIINANVVSALPMPSLTLNSNTPPASPPRSVPSRSRSQSPKQPRFQSSPVVVVDNGSRQLRFDNGNIEYNLNSNNISEVGVQTCSRFVSPSRTTVVDKCVQTPQKWNRDHDYNRQVSQLQHGQFTKVLRDSTRIPRKHSSKHSSVRSDRQIRSRTRSPFASYGTGDQELLTGDKRTFNVKAGTDHVYQSAVRAARAKHMPVVTGRYSHRKATHPSILKTTKHKLDDRCYCVMFQNRLDMATRKISQDATYRKCSQSSRLSSWLWYDGSKYRSMLEMEIDCDLNQNIEPSDKACQVYDRNMLIYGIPETQVINSKFLLSALTDSFGPERRAAMEQDLKCIEEFNDVASCTQYSATEMIIDLPAGCNECCKVCLKDDMLLKGAKWCRQRLTPPDDCNNVETVCSKVFNLSPTERQLMSIGMLVPSLDHVTCTTVCKLIRPDVLKWCRKYTLEWLKVYYSKYFDNELILSGQ